MNWFLWRKPDGTLVELDESKVRVIETDDGWAYEYRGDLQLIDDSVSEPMSSDDSPSVSHE